MVRSIDQSLTVGRLTPSGHRNDIVPILHNDIESCSFGSQDSSPSQPLAEANTEGERRVHKAVCVVDDVSADWESNGHFGQGLQHRNNLKLYG